jgi:hypothetical protein
MSNETGAQALETQATPIHSLIPFEDFKAILGVDDRENALSRFCLAAATFTIEQYCRRRLYMKRHYERIEFHGDPFLPLREYPVREVLALYEVGDFTWAGELVEPDLYRVIPDLEGETGEGPEDTVYSLSLSPAVGRSRGLTAVKAVYRAGYGCGEADPYGVPADLASACMELAAWNMTRYRGQRIGVTGNVRGSGKEGEHLEASMPENVRLLLEPYKRRVI